MGITLSDGTRLSARVWMPADAADNPAPAILEYLPYRKRDGTCARDALTHPWFASRGYACLRVDIRGNGDSEGVMTDEYTAQELTDAVEVIAWIAAQPWCSGKVGMMGISWGGFNALQVAALRPPELGAIITLASTADRFADDIHYKGGCLLGANLSWSGTMLSYSSRPPDPAIVGDKWRDMWLERLENQPHLLDTWLGHQRRDSYWRHGSICEVWDAIEAPTLAIAGWADGYRNTVPALVENLKCPVKGIVGPWIHKYPHIAAPGPQIGFLQEALRWWDRWLKGAETGVEDDPDLRLYLMDSIAPQTWFRNRPGRWIAQDFRNASTSHLNLSGSALAAKPGPVDARVASRADTGTDTGEYFTLHIGPDLPGDQRRDDAYSTCFDSAPLTQETAIVGAPAVELKLASDSPVAQLSVRLNDVRPDGSVTRITHGVLNLTHRDNPADPKPMPVGETVTIRLKLDHIAYRLPAGHKLRLSVSNACWPFLWPAPGVTELTLSGGSLTLPLLAEEPVEVSFEDPETAPPWTTQSRREPNSSRVVRFDQTTGLVSLEKHEDHGEVEDAEHGLVSGSVAREWWEIDPDNPLLARGQTHWTQTHSRGEWQTRTETFSELSADHDTFHVTARIEAFEGRNRVFARNFEKVIPRKLV